MALDLCSVMVLFTITVAHFLSNWIGVGPWGCFIYSRVVWSKTDSRVLMYMDPVSDSWVEDMKALTNLMLKSIVKCFRM